jgi:hypothetical protein
MIVTENNFTGREMVGCMVINFTDALKLFNCEKRTVITGWGVSMGFDLSANERLKKGERH